MRIVFNKIFIENNYKSSVIYLVVNFAYILIRVFMYLTMGERDLINHFYNSPILWIMNVFVLLPLIVLGINGFVGLRLWNHFDNGKDRVKLMQVSLFSFAMISYLFLFGIVGFYGIAMLFHDI